MGFELFWFTILVYDIFQLFEQYIKERKTLNALKEALTQLKHFQYVFLKNTLNANIFQ